MSEITASVLFQGLARPPMLFGVTLNILIANSMVHGILFVGLGKMWPIISAITVHIVARIMCAFEPNCVSIFSRYVMSIKINKAKNKFYGNVYECS